MIRVEAEVVEVSLSLTTNILLISQRRGSRMLWFVSCLQNNAPHLFYTVDQFPKGMIVYENSF